MTTMNEIVPASPPRITLREFKMWLDGLLSGGDDRRDLPSLDQWRKILTMIDRIEDKEYKPVVAEPATAAPPIPLPARYYVTPTPNYQPMYPNWTTAIPPSGGTFTIGTANGTFTYPNTASTATVINTGISQLKQG